MNRLIKWSALALLFTTGSALFAQEKEVEKTIYEFTETVNVKHTPVDNQGSSGTCWCFAGTGFIEAEILRMYGKELNLSEMYLVRHAWEEKVVKYVKMHGCNTLSQGGEVIDALLMLDRYGMMPDDEYTGKVIGETKHMHGEMNEVITNFAKSVTKRSNGKLTPTWQKAMPGILDAYLGEVPENFTFEGKKHTPKSFANAYKLNLDDYIEIASFTDQPLNKPFMVEIPDNWTWTPAYNLEFDKLFEALDHALEQGYTVGWAQDVSDKGFSRKLGVAIVAEDFEDPKLWEEVVPEKTITAEDHQKAYDNWETTDDHSMLIVGIAKDQNGTKYYKVKNSWGDAGPYKGYWYCSESFVKLHTVFFTLHKDALPKAIRKNLGL
ncbi:MAG: aminopeptidase [Bacteroidales bacterium]|nr:aminopeptidase [Bacteroidales bacterium]